MYLKNVIFIANINRIFLLLGLSKGKLNTRRCIHNYNTDIFNVIVKKMSCFQYSLE